MKQRGRNGFLKSFHPPPTRSEECESLEKWSYMHYVVCSPLISNSDVMNRYSSLSLEHGIVLSVLKKLYFHRLLAEMCIVFKLEANSNLLYWCNHNVAEINTQQLIDICSGFFTKAGFEPAPHLRLSNFPRNILYSVYSGRNPSVRAAMRVHIPFSWNHAFLNFRKKYFWI